MIWQGKAKRIEDIDLPRVGRMIGVGEDEIHAILDVESAGSGFDSKGRVKMLFEPHIFYRELGKGAARDKAVAQGLARPSWKRDYPKDSYPRLIKAMEIDREKALRSASWGLGQIMGFNHEKAGYASAAAMVVAFSDDEDKHLEAMINFIVAAGLDDELRRHDWKGFARGYNGAGFAKNGYDRKLKAAFERWQKIKDTPFLADYAKPAPKLVLPDPIRTAETLDPVAPAEKPASGMAAGGMMVAIGAAVYTFWADLADGARAFWDNLGQWIEGLW